MLYQYKNGQTSVVLRVFLMDSSVSTGAGKTGLTISSTGLIISTIADNEASATTYTAGGSTIETIATLGTFAAPTATKCRFKEVDATNHPGMYEIQIADARFAVSNAKSMIVTISGVTNLATRMVPITLTSADPYDGVRGGYTALPNAIPAATGGLPICTSAGVPGTDWNAVANQSSSVNLTGTSMFNVSAVTTVTSLFSGNLHVASATSTTLTMSATLSTVDNQHAGYVFIVTSGTGAGQVRTIKSDVAATKVVTVDRPFVITPDSTSVVVLVSMCCPPLDSSLQVAANATQIGGTSQTGRDIGATLGVAGAGLTALGDSRLGNLDAAVSSRLAPAGTLATVTNLTNAPLDSSGTTTLLARLTSSRAGYLDNLSGGAVALHSDITSLNLSASKHLSIFAPGWQERPESGSVSIQLEIRTFSGATGIETDADSTPTITATGGTSGSLSANLGTVTRITTGVYTVTYSVTSAATLESVRFDAAATISSTSFTIPCYVQVFDEVSATWTTTDASHLTAIYNKLPAGPIADETLVLAAVGSPFQATSDFNATQKASITAAVPTAVQNRQEMDSNSTKLAAILAASSGGAGTGANDITITVTDGTDPLENATVTAWINGSIAGTGSTNSSGVVVLSLDAGTYTLNVALAGFNGSSQSLVVSAPASHTYALTALSVSASVPPLATGWLLCLDGNGNPIVGVAHYFHQIGVADGATGASFSRTPWTVQSDSDGLVQAEFTTGCSYYIKRGESGSEKKFTASDVTFALPDVLD